MDFGDVIRRSDDDFVVFADLDSYGSGYNVVSKTIDPCNKYELGDVRKYCQEHPDKVHDDWNPIHPQPEEPTWEDRMEAQIIYTAMMTDTLIEEE